MKLVFLLLLSPLVASSFTSICPQQPNNVVVNCNNQNPFNNPLFPGTLIPGTTIPRGRVLDSGYRKQPVASKLEFQRRRTDDSEESSKSDESIESDESSEEVQDHRRPSYYSSHHEYNPQTPFIHSTTTVDNKLDFMRRHSGDAFRNNLRYLSKNHVPGHRVDTSTVVDNTHGHGHSGQYNHDTHRHEHRHGHHHEHSHGHHYGHNLNHEQLHVPNLPILIPTSMISGAHIIPEQTVPVEHIVEGGNSDTLLSNQGHININVGVPPLDNPALQHEISPPVLGSTGPAMDLVHDTHDRLVLTRRGNRALDIPYSARDPYEEFLGRLFMVSIPTITQSQDGFNTEINCDPIPAVAQDTTSGTVVTQPLTTLNADMLPGTQSASTFVTSDSVDNLDSIPQAHGETTVTKVTTTKVEERPVTTGVRVPMEESGSTVTKVTTTKFEKVPETSVQSGSTVTKVTTTKTEEHPVATDVFIPDETVTSGGSMSSTVTKVTTTTVEKRPVSSIVASNSGSTVTKVTTTNTEERPTSINIPITTVQELPLESGSTITKVTTTTTTQDKPITSQSSTILQELPVEISGE